MTYGQQLALGTIEISLATLNGPASQLETAQPQTPLSRRLIFSQSNFGQSIVVVDFVVANDGVLRNWRLEFPQTLVKCRKWELHCSQHSPWLSQPRLLEVVAVVTVTHYMGMV